MKLALIRHGKTAGNLEKRYIGCGTDEPLCTEGILEIRKYLTDGHYPAADKLYVSPMRRCRETAAIVYPELDLIPVADFRECDFGRFEGKNFRELTGDPEYQAWIDSSGTLPFPEGESREAFVRRTWEAFCSVMEEIIGIPFPASRSVVHISTEQAISQTAASTHASHDCSSVDLALVVHGGTIMALTQMLTGCDYYTYQISNGGYLLLELQSK